MNEAQLIEAQYEGSYVKYVIAVGKWLEEYMGYGDDSEKSFEEISAKFVYAYNSEKEE